MSNLSINRIIRMAIGGAVGGFITFLILNPSYVLSETSGKDTGLGGLLLGTAVAVPIGVMLVLVEELQTLRAARIAAASIASTVVAVLFGTAGAFMAGYLYIALRFGQESFELQQVLARTVAWGIMGAAAGICPGAVARSTKSILHGAIGGLIGGGIGGFLFDIIGAFTSVGSASRFVGFVLMGAAIGAAVGLVEEYAKEYWLTILSGAKEGRSYILSKTETTIGRDELADIPLFGDVTVQKRHAKIVKDASSARIIASPGLTVALDSQMVSDAPLSDGSIITIGKHRLKFGSRHPSYAPSQYPQPQYASAPQYGAGAPQPYPPAQAYAPVQPAALATRLQTISGPHAGEVFPLSGSPLVIGREPGCNIPLVRDGLASRRHATIIWTGAEWRLEDLQSTNGLFVNGQKVDLFNIKPGDRIALGQSALVVA